MLNSPAVRVSTARRYDLIGDLDDTDVALVTRRLLANDTIERSAEGPLEPSFAADAIADVTVVVLAIEEQGDVAVDRHHVLGLGQVDVVRCVEEGVAAQQVLEEGS